MTVRPPSSPPRPRVTVSRPAGSTLALAWGNPGRMDDGLGPAVAAELATEPPPGLRIEIDYQLQIEHALDIAACDRVVFIDADRSGPGPFRIRRLCPESEPLRFTSHEVSPTALLALCSELTGHTPEAWLLGVRGYEFDRFGEGVSDHALRNAQLAAAHVRAALTGNQPWDPDPTAVPYHPRTPEVTP